MSINFRFKRFGSLFSHFKRKRYGRRLTGKTVHEKRMGTIRYGHGVKFAIT